jgi:hypothetical protein
MAFNKGDVVICIDDSYSFCELILNEHYIVREVYDNGKILLKDVYSKSAFFEKRFILDKNYYRKEKIKKLRNGI